MKYKVGDTVRIKSIDWYNKNRNSLGRVKGFMPEMYEYLGKEAIIVKCYECSYELNIDHHFWSWDDEMFDENKMESKKVKITLPKNCEVEKVETTVEDGYLVVEYTPKSKFEPKDGDILTSLDFIVIYKGTNIEGGIISYCFYDTRTGTIKVFECPRNGCGYTKDYHPATEEEKKCLLDKLKENGYAFNKETMEMEKIKWRAKKYSSYYFINAIGKVINDEEDFSKVDSDRFEIGNYFKTEEEAQEYADKFKELLKNR